MHFIFWLSIICSLLVSTLGISKHRPYWLLTGAVLSLGYAVYLIGLPAYMYKAAGFLLPALHIVAMLFLIAGRKRAAGLLLLPQVALAVYLSVKVFTQ